MGTCKAMMIEGTVRPGFESLRGAFADNFSPDGECPPDRGASLSVWHRGKPLASLWGGWGDLAQTVPFRRDSLVTVFSMTKALTSTCVLHLSERSNLDLDAPVARYWPEFGAAGKDTLTVRHLLSHQAGLPTVEGDFTLEQALAWDPVVEALASQTPQWTPGSAHGYHLRTFGWLVGELFKRVSGRTVGHYFRDELAIPLGLDWHLGLPADLEPRVAPLVTPPAEFHALIESLPKDLLLRSAMSTPSDLFGYNDMWNERRLHGVELPSSNSLANADAVARFYAALLGSDEISASPILSASTLADAVALVSSGPDRVLMADSRFGSGFQLQPWFPKAAGPNAFGHIGAGGAVGFADPDAAISFAYVPTAMHFPASRIDMRSEKLAKALYDCL